MDIDLGILDFIQSYLRCDILDTVIPFITKLGDGGILWIAFSAIMLLFPKTRSVGAAMAAALAIEALCCNVILKPLVGRIRPCDINTAVQLLIPRPHDFSFPSGHTCAAFASAATLFFGKNKLWIPTLVLAVLIGFSRLYLYVHYPSDVLVGALIGIVSGWLGSVLTKTILSKLHKRKDSDL